MDEPRILLGTAQFLAGPSREREAAEAWAFEVTHYFLRRVGEAPQVTYENGIYTVTGLVTTTHPADYLGVFYSHQPWDLDFCAGSERRAALRKLSGSHRWDGSAPAPVCSGDVGMIISRLFYDPSPVVREMMNSVWRDISLQARRLAYSENEAAPPGGEARLPEGSPRRTAGG